VEAVEAVVTNGPLDQTVPLLNPQLEYRVRCKGEEEEEEEIKGV